LTSQGILTESDISRYMARSLAEDPLFISPILESDQIGSTMIDLRLGQHFLLQKPSQLSVVDVFELATNPYVGESIDEGYDSVRVPYGNFFTLHTGQVVRIGTLEYVGMPAYLQGEVSLRHSMASIPVMASVATIQPGYRGIIVLGLENHGLRPVKLYPGMRIAHMELRHLSTKVLKPKSSRYYSSVVPEPIRIHKDDEIRYLGPSNDPIIFGIVSTIAAGRTRAVNYLRRQYGFMYFSLADHLKDIAHQQGIIPNRAQLQELGNKVRKMYGPSFLAERLRLSRSWIETNHPFIIVDSFKNRAEVREFRKQGRFNLISIDAPEEKREQTLRDRTSPRDYGAEDFEEIDELDRGSFEDTLPYHLEVDKVIKIANEPIINDGSIDDLHIAIDKIVEKLIPIDL